MASSNANSRVVDNTVEPSSGRRARKNAAKHHKRANTELAAVGNDSDTELIAEGCVSSLNKELSTTLDSLKNEHLAEISQLKKEFMEEVVGQKTELMAEIVGLKEELLEMGRQVTNRVDYLEKHLGNSADMHARWVHMHEGLAKMQQELAECGEHQATLHWRVEMVAADTTNTGKQADVLADRLVKLTDLILKGVEKLEVDPCRPSEGRYGARGLE